MTVGSDLVGLLVIGDAVGIEDAAFIDDLDMAHRRDGLIVAVVIHRIGLQQDLAVRGRDRLGGRSGGLRRHPHHQGTQRCAQQQQFDERRTALRVHPSS